MSSLLSTPFKNITDEELKRLGFRLSPWGTPARIIHTDKYKRAKLEWNDNQYFWEYIDNFTDDHYIGVIYYFPENFEGYVTSFQGKNSTKPNGKAIIDIDNSSRYTRHSMKEIMSIDYIEDINLAIAILKDKLRIIGNGI